MSAPRSLPARSMSENFPCTRCMPGDRTTIWNTACERDELELADVCNRRRGQRASRGAGGGAAGPRGTGYLAGGPGGVAVLDELEHLVDVVHHLLGEAHDLHLLLAVLQHPQLGLVR